MSARGNGSRCTDASSASRSTTLGCTVGRRRRSAAGSGRPRRDEAPMPARGTASRRRPPACACKRTQAVTGPSGSRMTAAHRPPAGSSRPDDAGPAPVERSKGGRLGDGVGWRTCAARHADQSGTARRPLRTRGRAAHRVTGGFDRPLTAARSDGAAGVATRPRPLGPVGDFFLVPGLTRGSAALVALRWPARAAEVSEMLEEIIGPIDIYRVDSSLTWLRKRRPADLRRRPSVHC